MDGEDRFNFGSRVSFRFVSGFSVSCFTTTPSKEEEEAILKELKGYNNK